MNPLVYQAFLIREREKERSRAEAATVPASGEPIQPRKPAPVAASSTATLRPLNPFVIQSDRQAAIQAQVAANTPVLKPTGYVPEVVQNRFKQQQAYKEAENTILNVADGASMMLPVPVVGQAVGVLGAGVGAGIRASRAADDARHGHYLSAAGNAVTALGSIVVPRVLNSVADRVKRGHVISALARKPTFAPDVAGVQASADVGADWARNWYKGRAESSMGGLTPADAAMSQAIKRPVVPNVPTWKVLAGKESPGTETQGIFFGRRNLSTISPTAKYPESTALHEATHQYQEAMENNPAMKKGLATIVIIL